MLLSASSVSSMRYVLITPSSAYVNQQQGSFIVDLDLVKVQAAYNDGHHQDRMLDEPVTVDLNASLESTAGGPSTASSSIFAPVSESVTFPAGVAKETVDVPINSTMATPGPATILLSATTTSSSVSTSAPADLQGGRDAVTLYSGSAASITSVQLVTEGKLASAIVLGFNAPMTPASVENIQNYRILSRPITIAHKSSWTFSFSEGPGTFQSVTQKYQTLPLAAANYDASASTVTLTLERPVKASTLYAVSSAYPVDGHELFDPEGEPLTQTGPSQGGNFTILVHGNSVATLMPVGGTKFSSAGTAYWISG